MQLGALHYIYILMVIIVIVTMAFKKDIVLPCIIGLFVMGYASSGSLLKGVQVIYNSLIASGGEFWGIIVIISLVVAMSKALKDMGADELMMKPVKMLMINRNTAFWVLGAVMLVVSWFIWPSPAIALVGAIMLPAAIKTGLPAIWAAVAMNLFGHGIGLSSDYFIQGAPSVTAKAAGFQDPMSVIFASLPLWITMSAVTIAVAFFMMSREMKKVGFMQASTAREEQAAAAEGAVLAPGVIVRPVFGQYFVAIITPLVFVLDMFIMYKYKLKGGDATALVGGTAMLVMSVVAVIQHKFVGSLEKVTNYIKDGFIFGIKIFAPVVIIGAFFFLGSEGTAKQILGENATGLLSDIGIYLSNMVPLSKIPVALTQSLVGGITGLDGSGFSGLPLVGSLAQTFSTAAHVDKATLGALGQISAIWVGGGTIIPWGVIPVAAICGVDPVELARKNLIPVLVGLAATAVVAIIIM